MLVSRFDQTRNGKLLDCVGMKVGLQRSPQSNTIEQARNAGPVCIHLLSVAAYARPQKQ